MKQEVIRSIENEKLIVIVRGVAEDKIINLAEALYLGGVRLIEVTYSANGKVSDEDTARMIETLAQHFEGKMYVGAGTVISEKQVELTYKAGGKFIISPDTNENIIKKTAELGMVSIPGAYTPTEIQFAHSCGADFVKLFPATVLGPSYVKAVRAPLCHIKLLAVGGIDENNIPDYLKVGISGFGVGSNITKAEYINNNEWNKITELAQKYQISLKGEQK